MQNGQERSEKPMRKTILMMLLVFAFSVILVKNSAIADVSEKVTLIGVVIPSYDGLKIGVIDAVGKDGRTIIVMRGGRYKIIGENTNNMDEFKDKRVQVEGVYRENESYLHEILVKSINETTKTELEKKVDKEFITAGTLDINFGVNSPYLILSLKETDDTFYMRNIDFIHAGGNSLFGEKVIITYYKEARAFLGDKDGVNLAIGIKKGE